MSYRALKKFRHRGVLYAPGDELPVAARRWVDLRQLQRAGTVSWEPGNRLNPDNRQGTRPAVPDVDATGDTDAPTDDAPQQPPEADEEPPPADEEVADDGASAPDDADSDDGGEPPDEGQPAAGAEASGAPGQ